MAKGKIIEAQDRVVLCLTNSVQQQWDYLVVNFEWEEVDGERTRDTLAIGFVKQQTTWRRFSIIAPYECTSLLSDLCDCMAADGNKAWRSCTLEIDAAGKYRFSFSYERPKRLNGEFEDEAMLKHYTPRPL